MYYKQSWRDVPTAKFDFALSREKGIWQNVIHVMFFDLFYSYHNTLHEKWIFMFFMAA